MTDELANQQRWRSAGIGVIAACIAAVLAVLGVTLVFGGYKEKIEANVKRMDALETNVNQRLIRVEDKVDEVKNLILQSNVNQRRK